MTDDDKEKLKELRNVQPGDILLNRAAGMKWIGLVLSMHTPYPELNPRATVLLVFVYENVLPSLKESARVLEIELGHFVDRHIEVVKHRRRGESK